MAINTNEEILKQVNKIPDITTQLADIPNQTYIIEKASKSYVDTLTASISSGSPKGVYTTLSALTSAFPTGNTNTYIVTADGKWYYWNGSAWTPGGIYQSTAIADGAVTNKKVDARISPILMMYGYANYSLSGTTATIIINGTLKLVNKDNTYFTQIVFSTDTAFTLAHAQKLIWVKNDSGINAFTVINHGDIIADPDNAIVLLSQYNGYIYGILKDLLTGGIVGTKEIIDKAITTKKLNDETVTLPKLDKLITPVIKYTGNKIPNSKYKDNSVQVTLSGMLLLYYRHTLSAFKTFTFSVATTYKVPSFSSLIWDYDANEIIMIANSVTPPTNYVLLLHNETGNISGCLSDFLVVNQIDVSQTTNYYESYLNDKIRAIRDNEIAGGNNSFSFAFITDTHWEYNRKRSPRLLEIIDGKVNLSGILHGGDLIDKATSSDLGVQELRDYVDAFNTPQLRDKLLYAIGNHEAIVARENTSDQYLNHKQLYSLMFRHNKNMKLGNRPFNSGIHSGALYGYIDDDYNKVRYISLNGYDATSDDSFNIGGFSNTQLDWFGKVALNFTNKEVPTDWSVVVVTHYSHITNPTGAEDLTPYKNIDVIYGLLSAFKTGTSYNLNRTDTVYPVDLAVTFNTQMNNFICVLGGHTHTDSMFTSNGIQGIVTQEDGEYSGTEGTVTEQAFDVITVDKLNRTVKLTRIGNGSDRQFTY